MWINFLKAQCHLFSLKSNEVLTCFLTDLFKYCIFQIFGVNSYTLIMLCVSRPLIGMMVFVRFVPFTSSVFLALYFTQSCSMISFFLFNDTNLMQQISGTLRNTFIHMTVQGVSHAIWCGEHIHSLKW